MKNDNLKSINRTKNFYSMSSIQKNKATKKTENNKKSNLPATLKKPKTSTVKGQCPDAAIKGVIAKKIYEERKNNYKQ